MDESVIEVERPGSTTFALPPAPEAFSRAEPGVYTLRSTGEEVQGLDYTAQFTVMMQSDELPDDSS